MENSNKETEISHLNKSVHNITCPKFADLIESKIKFDMDTILCWKAVETERVLPIFCTCNFRCFDYAAFGTL